MTTTTPLEITQADWDDIQQCEAVVIREYEPASGGDRFARAVAWGDEEEMKLQAETPGLFVVPVGFKIVTQTCVKVSTLMGEINE